jgi:hypothetical protein
VTPQEIAAAAAACRCFGERTGLFDTAFPYCEIDEQGTPCPRLAECQAAFERKYAPKGEEE